MNPNVELEGTTQTPANPSKSDYVVKREEPILHQ